MNSFAPLRNISMITLENGIFTRFLWCHADVVEIVDILALPDENESAFDYSTPLFELRSRDSNQLFKAIADNNFPSKPSDTVPDQARRGRVPALDCAL
jgi:hypothetical protein